MEYALTCADFVREQQGLSGSLRDGEPATGDGSPREALALSIGHLLGGMGQGWAMLGKLETSPAVASLGQRLMALRG